MINEAERHGPSAGSEGGRVASDLFPFLLTSDDGCGDGVADKPLAEIGPADAARIASALAETEDAFGVSIPVLTRMDPAPVTSLVLSVRAMNALGRVGRHELGDLARMGPQNLAAMQNVGIGTVADICRALVDHALRNPVDRPGAYGRSDATSTPPLDNAEEQPQTAEAAHDADFELLCAWAHEVADARTIGGALAAISDSERVMPPEIAAAHNRFRSRALPGTTGIGWIGGLDLLREQLHVRPEGSVFLQRRVAESPATLEVIGQEMGISRERVRQLEVRGRALVDTVLASPELAPLCWKIVDLRSWVGLAAPVSEVRQRYDADLRPERVGNATEALWLFVYLAGPYVREGGWLLSTRDASPATGELVAELADPYGVLGDRDVLKAKLREARVSDRFCDAWIDACPFIRSVGATYVWWRGGIVSKSEALLAALGRPASPEELVELIGEGHNLQGARNQLFDAASMVRCSKDEVSLADWGLEEYTGIADAIALELESRGGSARVAELARDISARFKVAESSVHLFAQTPKFVLEDGIVRVRREDEPYVTSRRPADESRVYRGDGTGEYVFRLPVDEDMMRGSGRPLPVGLAAALGARPGGIGQRLYGTQGSIAISWSSASANGPSLGSVRAIADAVHAALGDELVLRLKAQAVERVSVVRAMDGTPEERLAGLLALPPEAIANGGLDAIAHRIWQPAGLTAEQLAVAAEARREHDIAALLRASRVST
jgi:hypothetical protein